MIILGLNAFHGDSSAALVHDGVLIAAAEEERFRRIKHWAGFPSQAITYCLREAGLQLGDVDYLAVNQNSWANFSRKIGYLATNRPNMGLIIDRVRNRRKRTGVLELLTQAFPGQRFRGAFQNIEHHLAHLSSAFHVSPSKKLSSCPLMASVTLPVRRGEWGREKKLRSRDGSISHTLSGSSIKP